MANFSNTWVVACPNGHIVSPRVDPERLRDDVARGAVRVPCRSCGSDFPLTQSQVATLRYWLRAADPA